MNTIDIGLGVLHIATGAFFVTSGARKCFMPSVRSKVCGLLASHKVPKLAQAGVLGGEFFGGLGLLTGTLTHLAAAGLILIMLGAYLMDTWPGVVAKDPPPYGSWPYRSKLLSNAMCTPEFQLLVIVTTLAFTGAGAFSLDHLIF